MMPEGHILLKYIDKTASTEEVQLVDLWLEESLDNRKHYQRILAVHYESQHLKNYTVLDVDSEWNEFIDNKVAFLEPIEDSLPHRKIFIYTAAASILLISAFFFLFQKSDFVTTATGSDPLTLTLPDASEVILYPNSSITYNEDLGKGNSRKIELAGKASFEVVSDKTRPFLVESGFVTTKVLGTVFTVDSYKSKEPSILVTEGTVSVAETKNLSNVRILKKGDSVVFSGGSFKEVIRARNQIEPIVSSKQSVQEEPVVEKEKKIIPESDKQTIEESAANANIPAASRPEAKNPEKEIKTTTKEEVKEKAVKPEAKLSPFPVKKAIDFLVDKHDNFSKSRKCKFA